MGLLADARMLGSMTSGKASRARIGIPWRTSKEEAEKNRPKIADYERAVEAAGGEAVLLPLSDPQALESAIAGLDGFVLPGSPADVAPEEYGAVNEGKSEAADLPRERTDRAILQHAFAEKKPVLAICYGCQLLNVYLGGTLIQDLRAETGTKAAHRKKDVEPQPADDPRHGVRFEAGSMLAKLAGSGAGEVNSSHHQSVKTPGRELEITGYSPDGIVESVEWKGDENWVVGVQWHPERMAGDGLAEKIFGELVKTAEAVKAS